MRLLSDFRPARILGQALIVMALWWVGDAVVHALHLPLSGGVLGLGFLLALLFSGRLKVERVQMGAQWLMAEMLLFFVPAAVAVVRYQDLLLQSGLRVVAVIIIGNAFVMLASAATVEAIVRRRRPPGGPSVLVEGSPA